MIQLTRKGLSFSGSQKDLDSLREQYQRDHCVILPRLFESELLEEIVQRVEAAQFLPRDHDGIGLEFCMADRATAAFLMFFPSNPAFLRLIEQVTGHTPLGEFNGRVYRMTSSDGHYDHWHNDVCENRIVTMSMNLSRQVFGGGALQIKRRDSNTILHEIHNTGFGDALLFRISPDLVHRVQGVTGGIPKTAFAGWFIEGEDLLANLRKRTAPSFRAAKNDEPDWKVPALERQR